MFVIPPTPHSRTKYTANQQELHQVSVVSQETWLNLFHLKNTSLSSPALTRKRKTWANVYQSSDRTLSIKSVCDFQGSISGPNYSRQCDIIMISKAFQALLLSFLLFRFVLTLCYYPDGTPARGDTPCSHSGNSTCCGSLYACMSNSICKSVGVTDDPSDRTGYVRGSCTDRSWSSDACPAFCINGK